MGMIKDQDFNALRELQEKINNTITQYGLFRYNIKRTELEYLTIISNFEKAQKDITKSYGEGTFNLNDGVFTPAEAKVEIPVAKIPKLPKMKLVVSEQNDEAMETELDDIIDELESESGQE